MSKINKSRNIDKINNNKKTKEQNKTEQKPK